MNKKRRPRKCWYMIYISECPLCGRTDTVRERQYNKRPKKPDMRYVYSQNSACSDHFI